MIMNCQDHYLDLERDRTHYLAYHLGNNRTTHSAVTYIVIEHIKRQKPHHRISIAQPRQPSRTTWSHCHNTMIALQCNSTRLALSLHHYNIITLVLLQPHCHNRTKTSDYNIITTVLSLHYCVQPLCNIITLQSQPTAIV